MDSFKDKIIKRRAKIGIIGLGYVGLPLAVDFARAKFEVSGIDIDKERIKQINQGRSYIPDVEAACLKAAVDENYLIATSDYKVLRTLDAIIICVPLFYLFRSNFLTMFLCYFL